MSAPSDLASAAATLWQAVLPGGVESASVTPEVVLKLNALIAQVLDNAALARQLAGQRDQARSALVREASRDPALDPAHWRQAFLAAFHAELFEEAREIARSGPPSKERDDLERLAELVARRRWREAAPLLDGLLRSDTVTLPARARLLAVLGQIELQIIQDTDAARTHIGAALSLAPEDWYTVFAHARLLAAGEGREEQKRAEDEYRRADKMADGKASEPAFAIGQMRLKDGDLAEAEHWFERATRSGNTPGEGYEGLIGLAGHRQLYAERRQRIPDLVRRACLLALNIAGQVHAFLAAAEAAADNGDEMAAAAWYADAIALDPLRTDVLLRRSSRALDAGRSEAALQDLEAARRIEPDSAEVDWGFTKFAEARGDWSLMLDEAMRTIEHEPRWAEPVVATLEDTARKLYGSAPDASEAVLDRLRAVRGSSYEPDYQNLIGNLRFWQKRFTEAAGHYRKAAAASPGEPQYHANLALALERLGTGEAYAEAVREIETAATLRSDPNDEAQHQRLLLAQRVVSRFGPAAQSCLPLTYRIEVVFPSILRDQVEGTGNTMNTALQTRVDALRQSMKRECGFTLCGINFRELTPDQNPDGTLAVEVAGARVLERHNVPADTDLAGVLAEAVRANLASVFGHDEAYACAESCPGGEEVQKDKARLNGLTQAIRRWLLDHDDLPDEALAGMVRGAEPAWPSWSAPDGPAPGSIWLPDLTAKPGEVQQAVFEQSGVVISLPAASRPHMGFMSWVELAGLLEPDCLFFPLKRLHADAPQLAAVAEAVLADRLVPALRDLLRAGRSIRNLRAALEQILLPVPLREARPAGPAAAAELPARVAPEPPPAYPSSA